MNIYQTLFDLINTYIFGGSIVAGTNQELVAMLVATFGVIFLVAVPFLLVWRILRLLGGI